MLNYSLTSRERMLVLLLRWWVVLFTVATIGFIFFPNEIISQLGIWGRILFGWTAPPLEPSIEKFWLVLTISLMASLIFAAIKAQTDIIKNISYVKLIMLAKLVSTLGFLAALTFSEHAFAYLAGAVIDGLILLITWGSYRRVTVGRYVK